MPAPGAQSISLSLEDAVRRGILYNLGAISSANASKQARAQRLAAIAQILPDITGELREAVQQTNLAAQGLRIHIPGFSFPSVVGPYNYFDARVRMAESLSLTALRNWRSSQESVRSSELSARDSRELVALAVAASYLQMIAAAARIQTVNAQIETAQAVYEQAVDRNRSGISARIDVNRSRGELQTQQQRLTSLSNEFEKEKLSFARLIGLSMSQQFLLTDIIPFRETPLPDLSEMMRASAPGRIYRPPKRK